MGSRSFSFRLNPTYDREARARLILQQWREEGYTVRHIVTEALLRLADDPADRHTGEAVEQMQDLVTTMSDLIEQIQQGGVPVAAKPPAEPKLANDLLASIKANARPGARTGG